MTITEVHGPDDVPRGVSDVGVCEIVVTCADAGLGFYRSDDEFVPFVVIATDFLAAPLMICEDCHGYLQEVYSRKTVQSPQT